MEKDRQTNNRARLKKETARYLPEIIVAAILGVLVFAIIMILLH